mmetsp:Transcript_30399/g.64133  ORF Transcript_30399/g.64133 Transcript_30399/m.64133 type:complete len:383 (-) Transcript_30399:240-1388(-)
MSRRHAKLLDQLLLPFFHFAHIALVQYHHLRLLPQQVIVHGQFVVQNLKISNGILARTVHDVKQYLAPLHVPQKRKSQSGPLGRSLDQPRNIAQHQPRALLAQIAHAQIRHDGRERIIGNLGPCRGRAAQQRRLPRVRHAQKPHVGHQSQFHAQPPLRPRLPPLAQFGGRATVRHERGVATSSPPAPRDHQLLAVRAQLPRHLLGVQFPHDGPARDADADVVAEAPVAVLSRAVSSGSGADVDFAPQAREGVEGFVGDEEDRASRTAAAAVGAAHGLALLASEGDAAVAAVASRDVEAGGVEEFVFLVVDAVASRVVGLTVGSGSSSGRLGLAFLGEGDATCLVGFGFVEVYDFIFVCGGLYAYSFYSLARKQIIWMCGCRY